jgi:arsenate reductase
MAEAFLKHLARGAVEAESAGTTPAERVNPVVVQAMKEKGIDISRNSPKLLTLEILERADRVVTMGCSTEKTCPAAFVPSEDWALEDPEGQPIAKVRQIRDEIELRVQRLLAELNRP